MSNKEHSTSIMGTLSSLIGDFFCWKYFRQNFEHVILLMYSDYIGLSALICKILHIILIVFHMIVYGSHLELYKAAGNETFKNMSHSGTCLNGHFSINTNPIYMATNFRNEKIIYFSHLSIKANKLWPEDAWLYSNNAYIHKISFDA